VDYWENEPEAIAVCLNCARDDCDEEHGCAELRRVVAGLRRRGKARRGKLVEVAGVRLTLNGWARALGINKDRLYSRVRRGEDPKAVVWSMLSRESDFML
jgi:hypothetical protein